MSITKSVRLVRYFNGEAVGETVYQHKEIFARTDLEHAIVCAAFGNGWGLKIHGSREALEEIGAIETADGFEFEVDVFGRTQRRVLCVVE